MPKSKFIEIPANKSSKSKRRSIRGVATNDADYIVQPTIQGVQITCPYYLKWKAMVNRCYNPYELNQNKMYIDCFVCGEWLNSFKAFKSWMENQEWDGKHLDKDILVIGNKVYSPETCCFVNYDTNSVVINNRKAGNESLPFGVCLDSESGKYLAQMRSVRSGVKAHIGYYDTPEEALSAYSIVKREEIEYYANLESDPRIKAGLLRHAERYKNGEID